MITPAESGNNKHALSFLRCTRWLATRRSNQLGDRIVRVACGHALVEDDKVQNADAP